MDVDMCRLTRDLLPLYEQELLSAEIHGLVEEHIRSCDECMVLLRAYEEVEPRYVEPRVEPDLPRDLNAMAGRFLKRLKTIGLVLGTALVIITGAGGVIAFRLGEATKTVQAQRLPMEVSSASEYARLVVPGWARAEALGMVVPLGAIQTIPGTEAKITFESAWYGGDRFYILYTVSDANRENLMATEAWIDPPARAGASRNLGQPLTTGNQYGGISEAGFHQVLVFDRYSEAPSGRHLALTVTKWRMVSPDHGVTDIGGGGAVSITLPMDAKFLKEVVSVYSIGEARTRLGRTIYLDRIEVSTREARLLGSVQLLPGETAPSLGAALHFGSENRTVESIEWNPSSDPGRFDFVARTSAPNNWPSPLYLELRSVGFQTALTLEAPIPWSRLIQTASDQMDSIAEKDQIRMSVYDGALVFASMSASGLGFRVDHPNQSVPYVTMASEVWQYSSDTGSGVRLVGASDETWAEFGVGDGSINSQSGQGLMLHFWEGVPQSLAAGPILFQFVHPRARMVLDEAWPILGVLPK